MLIQLSSLDGREFFIETMDITFHLVPAGAYDALAPNQDYVPVEFDRDGFIHCTDAPAEMEHVANTYYGDVPGAYYYLYIDKSRVRAPVRYEDHALKYPHIYGPLNRDAIVAVRPARRSADGKFMAPELLEG